MHSSHAAVRSWRSRKCDLAIGFVAIMTTAAVVGAAPPSAVAQPRGGGWQPVTETPPASTPPAGGLVEPGATVTRVAGGFTFTEGPAVDDVGDVYFSDVRTSIIHKWAAADGSVRPYRAQSGGANGLYFHPAGHPIPRPANRDADARSAGANPHPHARTASANPRRPSAWLAAASTMGAAAVGGSAGRRGGRVLSGRVSPKPGVQADCRRRPPVAASRQAGAAHEDGGRRSALAAAGEIRTTLG